jgi:hypothetical protein
MVASVLISTGGDQTAVGRAGRRHDQTLKHHLNEVEYLSDALHRHLRLSGYGVGEQYCRAVLATAALTLS